jgi:hypothetical protein
VGAFPAQADFPAPAPKLDWARSAGGPDIDAGSGIATDRRGNSYLTGFFSGTATFGAGEANQTELTSAGFDDVFVAKYAPDGTLLWVRSAGGTGLDGGRGIATDRRGNSYVTGRLEGAATFGAGEANQTELTSAGFTDLFVAKYAPDGALLWARSASGTGSEEGSGIATDRRGNSYLTGFFAGLFGDRATFGAGEANQTELTSAGDLDVFVAKYAPDGALLWARSAGGTDGDQAFGTATDRRGNSYVTGSFAGMATFGAGEANQTELISAGGFNDVFVAKYGPDGDLLWARSAGGTNSEEGTGIATDHRGNSYVTASSKARRHLARAEPTRPN